MKLDMPDLLPNRLNFDAVIFRGCTMKELQVIAFICLISCILIFGFLMKWLIDMFLLGMGFAFPASLGLSILVATCFQKAKQGRPKGYMKQSFLIGFEEMGLYKTPYVRRSGSWSIRRSLP